MNFAYQLCPCPIIAITGTNGKTTTTSLVGEIFRNFIKNTVIVGNIGIPFTEKVSSLDKNSCAVAEISSFQLEKIVDFKPKVSAVLNITPDHLNRHKNLENYISAKARIFENQNENDFLILNYDDEVCRNMKESAKCNVIFSLKFLLLIKLAYLKEFTQMAKVFLLNSKNTIKKLLIFLNLKLLVVTMFKTLWPLLLSLLREVCLLILLFRL